MNTTIELKEIKKAVVCLSESYDNELNSDDIDYIAEYIFKFRKLFKKAVDLYEVKNLLSEIVYDDVFLDEIINEVYKDKVYGSKVYGSKDMSIFIDTVSEYLCHQILFLLEEATSKSKENINIKYVVREHKGLNNILKAIQNPLIITKIDYLSPKISGMPPIHHSFMSQYNNIIRQYMWLVAINDCNSIYHNTCSEINHSLDNTNYVKRPHINNIKKVNECVDNFYKSKKHHYCKYSFIKKFRKCSNIQCIFEKEENKKEEKEKVELFYKWMLQTYPDSFYKHINNNENLIQDYKIFKNNNTVLKPNLGSFVEITENAKPYSNRYTNSIYDILVSIENQKRLAELRIDNLFRK